MGAERPDAEEAVLAAWGAVIRRYRQWKGLSRRELAQRAGLSPVFLGEIERGEKDASSRTVCLIAAALGAPLSELYLRVATRLDGVAVEDEDEQTSLPLGVRDGGESYLVGVPRARDETAYDLYSVVRGLRSDQQVSLLVLARSLSRDRHRNSPTEAPSPRPE